MWRDLLVALAVLTNTVMLPAGRSPEVADTTQRSDRKLVRRLECHLGQTAAKGFSGSVLVARGERVLIDRGYGWADAKRRLRPGPETRYWVASISKQFTAAGILKLEEQGRLATSDSIARWLPLAPEDKRSITLHHLLTHTSGIKQNYAADGLVDREEAGRAILAQPLVSAPGEQFHYANDNYNLLAMVVEVASGRRFEDYLREELLAPAGMRHSGFWGMLSEGEARATASLLRPIEGTAARAHWGFRGAVGVESTTEDLYRWTRALLADRVLRALSREKMLHGHVKLSDTEVGYGWYRSQTERGLRSFWTRGYEDFGHSAVVKAYPDQDLIVVVASNAGEFGNKASAASRVVAEEMEGIIEESQK